MWCVFCVCVSCWLWFKGVCVLFVSYCVMLHGMGLFVCCVVFVVCLCVFVLFDLVCDAVWYVFVVLCLCLYVYLFCACVGCL